MTEAVKGAGSGFVADLKALEPKQWAGIAAALVISLVLEIFMGSACMGFFVVAVVLYMVPHILGVSSVRIKTLIGVVFAVLAIMLGTFAFAGSIQSSIDAKDTGSDAKIQNIVYDEESNTLTFEIIDSELKPGEEKDWYAIAESVPIEGIAFGRPNRAGGDSVLHREASDPIDDSKALRDITVTYVGQEAGKYTYRCTVSDFDLDDGKLYLTGIGVVDKDNKLKTSVQFMIDEGSDHTSILFTGTAYTVAFALVIFYMILIFSTLMRRSAEKTRSKMEAEGRLYPQGYGRCKECGAVVLPGEVNCRKCGAYIDVPDEIKPHKKDFFQCTECGAEVPSDATECPRCGAKFDGTETEIVHSDGNVEITAEQTTCPDCGNSVPAGTEWCPRCGRIMKK